MVTIAFQVVEQLIIGIKALAEADAWVEDDLLLAVGFQNFTLLLEKAQHGLVDIAAKRVLVHGFRRAYAVHHHVRDVVLANIGQHLPIEKST